MNKLETEAEVLEWVEETVDYAWRVGLTKEHAYRKVDRAAAARLAKGQRLLEAFEEAEQASVWEREPGCGSCAHNSAWLARLRAALKVP